MVVGGLPLIVKPARAKDGAVPSVPSAAAPSAAARWIARSAPEAWWPPTAALWLRVRVNLPVLIAMLRAGRDAIHAVVSKGRSSGARCARSCVVRHRQAPVFFCKKSRVSACLPLVLPLRHIPPAVSLSHRVPPLTTVVLDRVLRRFRRLRSVARWSGGCTSVAATTLQPVLKEDTGHGPLARARRPARRRFGSSFACCGSQGDG